jgi:hypothetical protein
VKTIISIIELILFNLLPPALSAQVVHAVKDILPLLGIAFIRVGLYLAIWSQRLHNEMSQKLQQAKLFKLDNISRIEYIKKLRA